MTNHLLDEAARRAAAYLDGLGDRSVFPTPEALRGLDRFAEPLPDGPSDPLETLRLLDASARPPRWRPPGPRYFGFVIGGSLPATRRRQLARRRVGPERRHASPASPVAARPRASGARAGWSTCSGLPAGTAARSSPARPWPTSPRSRPRATRCCERAGWDVEADGLFGAPPITVIVGEEAHPTAAQGARPARARAQPRRDACRWTARDACAPTRCRRSPAPRSSACRRATSTPARSIRSREICARAHDAGAWVHVDGAFGLWAAASRRLRAPRRRASSAPTRGRPTRTSGSTCPTTAASPSCATPAALRAAMAISAAYLPTRATEREPFGLHARALAAGARRRGLGGAALARPRRRRRPDRAHLPARAALRRGPARGGLRGPQRRRAQPGAGLVRRRRDDRAA